VEGPVVAEDDGEEDWSRVNVVEGTLAVEEDGWVVAGRELEAPISPSSGGFKISRASLIPALHCCKMAGSIALP
jgi:hypothetical protein